jgi:hypothetical protein
MVRRNLEVNDITNDDQLIKFAAKSQVNLLMAGPRKYSQHAIAQLMGVSDPALADWLNKGMLDEVRRRLEAAIITLDPDLGRAGGLSAYVARLRGRRDGKNMPMLIAPVWTNDLLHERAERPVDVLLQASALLSAFLEADGAADLVCQQYDGQLRRVVEQLVLIGVSPPTPYSVEALILLGGIGRYAFKVVSSILERELHGPMGFRVWRVVTSIVHAGGGASRRSTGAAGRTEHGPMEDWAGWIQLQLGRHSEALRKASLYPARSLELELAIAVPSEWSPYNGKDWAAEVLRSRARDEKATVRERGTAALGAWERALKHGTPAAQAGGRRFLENLITQVAEEHHLFHTIPGGRAWLTATIRQTLESGERVCNIWEGDHQGQPCLEAVHAVAQQLTSPAVPAPILDAARFLFEHALLQNAGVYRRRAVDALRAGGLSGPVTDALGRLLDFGDIDVWLRCRALFAIGFLQERGANVQRILPDAYQQSMETLLHGKEAGAVTRDMVSEVHAALFAIGDCFGALGARQEAQTVRATIDETLPALVKECEDPDPKWRGEEKLFPVARAAAYMLTVTAQPEDRDWLTSLIDYPDPVVGETARWALAKRFNDAGTLQPLFLDPLRS